MKHMKAHASSLLSEGDSRLFELLEEYKKKGGDFGEEAKEDFRQALAKRLENPPEPDPVETAEFYRTGLLRLLEEVKRHSLRIKKKAVSRLKGSTGRIIE